MHYSGNLEYIVGNSYRRGQYSNANYFSKNTDDNYGFLMENPPVFEKQYTETSVNSIHSNQYKNNQRYITNYSSSHLFAPEIFLNPSRPKARFADEKNEAKKFAAETFELMAKKMGNVLKETWRKKKEKEEKAFAFSIEWAKKIKKHNIANWA